MCTGVGFITKDGNTVFGRTQEYAQPLPVQAAIIPRGFVSTEQLLTPVTFKYATLGMVMDGLLNDMETGAEIKATFPQMAHLVDNAKDTEMIMDGVNEKGLAGGSFYFGNGYNKYAEQADIEAAGKVALRGEEIVTYVLANYASVAEVKENINNDVQAANVKNALGVAQPQHYVFFDNTGASIAVEPDNYDGFTITDNPALVFTNTPHFDWHLKNLQNYVGLSSTNHQPCQIGHATTLSSGKGSGLFGLPGDFTPQSRFVRAAILRNFMEQPATVEAGLHSIYNLLAQFDIPFGAVRMPNEIDPSQEAYQYTEYTSAYSLDPNNLVLTVKTFEDSQIARLTMTPDQFEGDKVLRAAISRKQTYKELEAE